MRLLLVLRVWWAWRRYPMQRLGQFLINAAFQDREPLFSTDDDALALAVRRYRAGRN